MAVDLVDSVVTLYKEKKWKEIINNYHNADDRSKLLWVFPSEENIKFIQETLTNNSLDHIISIGCGSGLFEWILTESSGILVSCIEVDGAWWKCKYAPPMFSQLHFANPSLDDDELTIDILKNRDTAVMFCYFNNWPAFMNYMKYFKGSILIIIGPGKDSHTHTDPTPFDQRLEENWDLITSQEVRKSKDFIAIYGRKICDNATLK